jgi:hypothetical protein
MVYFLPSSIFSGIAVPKSLIIEDTPVTPKRDRQDDPSAEGSGYSFLM